MKNNNRQTRRAFALVSIALTALSLSSIATVSAAEQPIPKSDGKGLMNNEWMGIKTGTIGPEFGIGHVVRNAVDAPVMILKSCIGNRALGWHLLPPGSARFEEGEKVYAGYRDAPDSWAKGTEPTPPVIKEVTVTLKGDQPAGWYAGKEYDDDTADAKKVLADLDKHYPGAKSYEVA